MIGNQYIAQLEKQYVQYLKNVILEIPFRPIVLRGGKNKPATTRDLHALVVQFQEREKTSSQKGWSIEWQEWTSKKFGKQRWPSVVSVTSEEDYLYLISKESETFAFKDQLQKLLQWNPAIRQWLAHKPQRIPDLYKSWEGICAVVDYLLAHNVSGYFLRSIPVPVHTKFIERNKKVIQSILAHLDGKRFQGIEISLEEALQLQKKPFYFIARWLDSSLGMKYTAGMEVFAVPADYFQQQHWRPDRVIMVENETNLYLLPSIPRTLAIFCYGKALHLLKRVEFLHQTKIYYWGDLDEEGFDMLNAIRQYYSNTLSLFMDDDTIAHHGTELECKANRYKGKEMPLLQPHERRAYERLLQNNWWLEQEKLQQSFVQETLRKLLDK